LNLRPRTAFYYLDYFLRLIVYKGKRNLQYLKFSGYHSLFGHEKIMSVEGRRDWGSARFDGF